MQPVYQIRFVAVGEDLRLCRVDLAGLSAPVGHSCRQRHMRIAPLLLCLLATSLVAASILPSVEHSAAVLTGTVLSVKKVAVETNRFIKSEIWRAEVKVQHVTKQDTNLTERVFLYYEQNHVGEDGTHYTQVCPGRPQIAVGDRKMFYCIRCDAGDARRVLFIPERGWVTTP